MKRAAFAVLMPLALLAPAAHAQEPGGESAPDAPASDATPNEPPAPRQGHFVGRFGALGAYRGLYDLSILGGGLALSLGGESARFGGHANFHFLDARSAAGLVVLEAGVTGTAEWPVGDGFRVGLGGGWTYFAVQRATSGNTLQSLGPTMLGRVGYDFGGRPNLYILFDLEGQLQAASAVWGPTLQAGLLF